MARIRRAKQADQRFVWRIAFYIRLSREDGNDESLSIVNQRKILAEYVHTHFQEEYTIIGVYVDDGKTGTDVNRPDFMRMEKDICDGQINCVIVKSLARAFRNLGDQQKYLEEFFPLHGVRFINLGTPFIDSHMMPRPVFSMEVPIYGMFNEQFAASTSEEVRKTFDTKRRAGAFIGAFAPYGYRKHPNDKNRLIIDEEAAEVVRDIFNWFLYGTREPGWEGGSLSINGIAQRLNERGIPCPAVYKKKQGFKYQNPHSGHKDCCWTGSSVSRILKNRVYIGSMVQGRFRVISYKVHKQIKTPEQEWFVVENTHEPIIEQSRFEEVQRRLERDTRTAPGQKEVYLFSGLLRCADCGRLMHRKTSKNYVYYFCRTPQTAKGLCKKRSIRQDVLEEVVLQVLKTQVSIMGNVTRIVDKVNKLPRAVRQKDINIKMLKYHEKEQIKLTDMTDMLYADWKNGDITKCEYLRMKSGLTRKIEEITAAIQKIREESNLTDQKTASEDPYFAAFRQYGNISSLRRDLLIDLVDTIFLHENGGLTIRCSFTNVV